MAIHKGNKGIVLFIVMMTLLIVVILANIILQLMANQSRLTHHQISRIQAYYAGFGAGNYAFDKIRRNDPDWPLPALGHSYPRKLCRVAGSGCDIIEPDLPVSISDVTITVSSRGVNNCNPPGDTPYCITSTATYTYTP